MKTRGHLLPTLLALLWALASPASPAGAQPPAEPPAETEPAPDPPARHEPVEPTEADPEKADRDRAAAGANEEGDPEKAEDADGQATVKIECDLDCTVTVGLQPPQPVAAGEVLTMRIEPGAVRIQAYVTDVVGARTHEDVTVGAGDRQRVRLKMKKALDDLRKTEARDQTYRDVDTRLMWPTRDNGVDLEWQEAIDYCAGLEHGGWDDWRLPTLAELEDIEAMWSLRAYKTADAITLSSCCVWSSDRVDEDNAWNFNYRFRRPFRGHVSYSLSLRALCVRDGSDEIPENTRKNRRLAKREAKEKQRERRLRQAERDAAEAAAAAAEAAAKDDDGGSGGGS